jgi:Zn-dependent peptidase ImmA (M78 family)
MQAQCRGNHAAFAMWRERIESLGVLVLQAKGIDVEEMRGLALVHRFAPAILINSRDAVSARLFTLLHEFVHLMIGESAITGGEIFDSDIHAGTEKFCNQVAASTLIPADDLLNWLSSVGHVNGEAVSTLSRRYNVSQPVIALRLSEMNRIDSDLVSKIIAIALSHRPAQEKKEIKIKPFRLAIGRNGKYFSRLAHSAFEQGEIHGGQLSALLGLKLQHLPALENALYRSSGDIESE